MTGVVVRQIRRADAETIVTLERLGVGTAHAAQGRGGLLHPYMRPGGAGGQMAGSAVTALCHPATTG